MKKALSIILAILMIVTTIPFALAADETPDFSDAKVLTSIDGVLYIDGVEAKTDSSKLQSRIYEGKYILEGDIETSKYIYILGSAIVNLNGYTWNLADKYINVNAPLSIYDTSEAETGKITAAYSGSLILLADKNAVFSLYSGTIENTSNYSNSAVIAATTAAANFYAGKIKSNAYAINCYFRRDNIFDIDDTLFEPGEGYPDIRAIVSDDATAESVIDVSDYTGNSLTVDANISVAGKIVIFKGIENAEAAENFKINYTINESYGIFYEETAYDEATGEKYVSVIRNTFTQQPSADNNFTADFNNPAATFQWYEVEEKNIGTYIVEEFSPLFSYDFKAGDILVVSTDSEFELVVIETGIIDTDYEYIHLDENEKTATITFDADTTIDFFASLVDADNPVEVNFTLINETKLDGETEKTLQNAECDKSYYCKSIVGENVYVSDTVIVGHNIVSIDAKAPTCTEIGWEAYEYCTACDYTTYEEIPALTHTDEDGDYICDNGCGYEYEKPEEPAPEEPSEPETPDEPANDNVCEDCGKVHDGFFAELICFFTKIINFIKNLFA